jgi:hypothetical protein
MPAARRQQGATEIERGCKLLTCARAVEDCMPYYDMIDMMMVMVVVQCLHSRDASA